MSTIRKSYDSYRRAFTIVELLIVIVVIAILASISIVAYNGIQARAENSKTVAAVNAYKKALQLYKLDNNSFPTNGGMCLGNEYPLLSATETGCRNSDAVLSNTAAATMTNALKPYMGNSVPMPSTKQLSASSGRKYVGTYFYGTNYNLTLDGVSQVGVLYTVESSTCPIEPSFPGSSYPNFTSNTPGVYSNFGGGIICITLTPTGS